MDNTGPVPRVVSMPPLAGSILSMVATTFVRTWYFVLPRQKHFWHVLITNLAVAGTMLLPANTKRLTFIDANFLKGCNNTISGLCINLSHQQIIASGPVCDLNAWIGQISVQVCTSDSIELWILLTHICCRLLISLSLLPRCVYCGRFNGHTTSKIGPRGGLLGHVSPSG